MPTSWNILFGFLRQPLTTSVQDNLGVTDSPLIETGSLRVVADNLGLSENWLRSVQPYLRVRSENLGATENFGRSTKTFRSLSDNLALSELLKTIDQQPSAITWQTRATDSLGVTDLTNLPIVTWQRKSQDNLGALASAPTRSWQAKRKLADNLGNTDQETTSFTSSGTGAPSIAQISVTTNPANEVIQTGQTLGVTYTIKNAVAAWLFTPDGQVPLIADGNAHTIQYDSFQSGINQQVSSVVFVQAQDQFGNVAAYRFNAVVQDNPALPPLNPTAAATFTSVKSGNWTDPTVWGNPVGGAVPGRDDITQIQAGHTVSGTGRTCQTGRLIIFGTFSFANGGFYVTDIDGKPGSTFSLGDGQSTSLIILRNRASHPTDTALFWPAVNLQGTVLINGAPVTTYTRLVGDAHAGDTALTVVNPPTGWRTSNKLFLPDTRQDYDASFGGPIPGNFEIVQVRAVVGSTVYLMQPLAYDHLAGRDAQGNVSFSNANGAFMMWTPHVVNLERNAGFVTTDPTNLSTRAHCYIWGASAVLNAQYGLWHGLGRTTNQTITATNPASRYNCYLEHLYGPSGGLPNPWQNYQYRLDSCVFLDPWPIIPTSQARWGLAISDCHWGYINQCISFNWAGAAFAFLTGYEKENVIQGNFACFISGGGQRADRFDNVINPSQTDANLLAMEGAGIWLRGPLNHVRNNVCCNIYSIAGGGPYPDGIVMFVGGPGGTFPVPNFRGANTTVSGQFTMTNLHTLPITEWANNECYGTMNGFTYWYAGYDPTTDTAYDPGAGTVLNQLVWNPRQLGIFGYPANKPVIDGLVVRSDPSKLLLGQGPQGYTQADYRARGAVFIRWDILAAEGVQVPWSAASQGQGGTTFTVQDCNFNCSVGIEMHTPWTSSGGADQAAFQPITDAIINCKFTYAPWPATFAPQACAIYMNYQLTAQPNLIVSQTVLVTNYNGVVGDNFQVFYTQQDPSFVMPQTQTSGGLVILLGQPAAGTRLPDGFVTDGNQTNGQLVSHGATPLAGALLPASFSSRPGIFGYVH